MILGESILCKCHRNIFVGFADALGKKTGGHQIPRLQFCFLIPNGDVLISFLKMCVGCVCVCVCLEVHIC